MENWEYRLSEKLINTPKRDRTIEHFSEVRSEIIRPTFEKIKTMLYEYYINCSLGSNDASLTVEAINSRILLLTLEFKVLGHNEIIAKTTYFDTFPLGKNAIIKVEDKIILLDEITEKLVSDIFVDAFEKTTFFD